MTCSRHLPKHRSLKDASPEVGASCSSRILPTVSTGYPRVPHGSFSLCQFLLHQTDSFFPYVFCCIPIPVMVCPAPRTDPRSHRHILYFLVLAATRTAQLGTWIITIDPDQAFSRFLQLVTQKRCKHSPSSIRYGFSMMFLPCHLLQIKIFDTYAIPGIGYLSGFFM